jgi:hypothetical protein
MFDWVKRRQASAGQVVHGPVQLPQRCSFCDNTGNDGRKLIAGPAVFICEECVEVCVDIIADDPRYRAYSQDSAESRRLRRMAAALPRNRVACSVCRRRTVSDEMLAIDDRGALCVECADAVEDALAQRQRRD